MEVSLQRTWVELLLLLEGQEFRSEHDESELAYPPFKFWCQRGSCAFKYGGLGRGSSSHQQKQMAFNVMEPNEIT